MTAAEVRIALKAAGFGPVACIDKDPILSGWRDRLRDATPAEIARWPGGSTGVDTSDTPAMDIDFEDPEAAARVEDVTRDWCDGRGIILARFGRAPRRALLFRTVIPFSKLAVAFIAPNGSKHKIEFLGDGQQVIVDGPHPVTGKRYSWHADLCPWKIKWGDLVEITEAEARELMDHIAETLKEELGFERAEPERPATNGAAGGHATAPQRNGPVDVEAALAAMAHEGGDHSINETLKHVIPSLLARGEHPDDVHDRILAAVWAIAERGRLRWSREKEIKHTIVRILAGYNNVLIKGFDTATGEIPVWLPGEFHERWIEVITEWHRPVFGFNRGGFHIKKERGPNRRTEAKGTVGGERRAPGANDAAAPKKYRFPLIGFGDLRPGSEQSYLIDELFPTAGLALVYGAPKSGKSFWTFDAMMHVALAWEYRERAVQSGPVVYCAFEGAHGYHKRGEAFRRHHCLTDERPPMFVVPGRADLIKDHAALTADVRAQLADAGIAQPPKAVVLDTLNKSLIGSESKDVDMANYIAAAEAIQKAFNCLVVIVHHHGIEESRPRGHTSLRGAIDVMIKITRDVQNHIIAIVEEMRDGPEGAQIASRLVVVTAGKDLKGRPLTSAAVETVEMAATTQRGPRLTPNQKTMLSLLEEAGPGGLTVNEWNDRAREAGLGKHRRATLADLRAELRHKRLVTEQGERWVTVATPRGDL